MSSMSREVHMTVALIGPVGSGKTTLSHWITNRTSIEEQQKLCGVTKDVETSTSTIALTLVDGTKVILTILDTPGIGDQDVNVPDMVHRTHKALLPATGGPPQEVDVVFLVSPEASRVDSSLQISAAIAVRMFKAKNRLRRCIPLLSKANNVIDRDLRNWEAQVCDTLNQQLAPSDAEGRVSKFCHVKLQRDENGKVVGSDLSSFLDALSYALSLDVDEAPKMQNSNFNREALQGEACKIAAGVDAFKLLPEGLPRQVYVNYKLHQIGAELAILLKGYIMKHDALIENVRVNVLGRLGSDQANTDSAYNNKKGADVVGVCGAVGSLGAGGIGLWIAAGPVFWVVTGVCGASVGIGSGVYSYRQDVEGEAKRDAEKELEAQGEQFKKILDENTTERKQMLELLSKHHAFTEAMATLLGVSVQFDCSLLHRKFAALEETAPLAAKWFSVGGTAGAAGANALIAAQGAKLVAIENSFINCATRDMPGLMRAYDSAASVSAAAGKASVALGVVGVTASLWSLHRTLQMMSEKKESEDKMAEVVAEFLKSVEGNRDFFQKLLTELEGTGCLPDPADGMLTWVTHTNIDAESVEGHVKVSVPLGPVVFSGAETNAPMTPLPSHHTQIIENDDNLTVSSVKQGVFIWSGKSRAESTTIWFMKNFELVAGDRPFDNNNTFMSKQDFDKALSTKFAFKPKAGTVRTLGKRDA